MFLDDCDNKPSAGETVSAFSSFAWVMFAVYTPIT